MFTRFGVMLLMLWAVMTPQRVNAQAGGGSIVGNVLDESGASIADATVRARQTATNVVNESRTNSAGYYEFPLLPAGRYTVEVEKQGFQKARSEVFDLSTGTRPRLDFGLKVASVAESLDVVATAPVINTTTTDLGMVMPTQKIESLPLNGRNFQQLVGLQAGVLDKPAGSVGSRGGIEFNGSPAFGNNLLLDGVDMSFGENNGLGDTAAGTGGNGTLINTVSVEAIQEFKATGSAFSAEFGRATGGVLQVTTKSGTNQFHGTLFHFFRNDKLDAAGFFNNRSNLARPSRRQNQYGGNIGGPVKKDKLFFFFNYEGATVRRYTQIQSNVPTPLLLSQVSGPIRQHLDGLPKDFTPTTNPLLGFHRRNDRLTNDENTYMSRADWRFNNSHQLAFRYNYNHQNYFEPNLYPTNQRQFPMRYHNAVVQDNWTVSPTVFNELRLGFNRTSLNRVNSTLYTQPGWVEIVGAFNSDFQSQLFFITNNYTIADNLTLIRGNHSVKMGFEIRDNRSARIQSTNVTHFFNSLTDLIADNPNRVRVTFGNPGGRLQSTAYGFFVQDDWRVSRNLLINMGVRYEYFTPLKGGYNVAGSDPFGDFTKPGAPMFAKDGNNFGPRLGMVWNPFGNQKTVLRAGGGISYAPPQPFFYYDGSFIRPEIPFNADFARADVPATQSLAFPFPQAAFAQSVIANPANLPRGFILSRLVADYNRRDEYAGQWNLSVQREVNPSLAMQVSYVGSRALKMLTGRFPNQFLPGQTARPRPDLGSIYFRENASTSSYHGLQVSVNQRLKKGFSADFYYTWSHGMGYYGADAGYGNSDEGGIQDNYDARSSYGPKVSDLRHRGVIVFTYQVPTLSSNAVAKHVLGGWAVQGITSLRTGFPLNVLAGVDLVRNQRPNYQRPDVVSSDVYASSADGLTYLNRAAFDIVTPGAQRRYGNLGYNALRSPGSFNMDASLHKNFRVREGHTFSFRLEAFNALNHFNPGGPVNSVSNPNFGIIQSGSGGRNLQLGAKYIF
ncbi:MAG: carboxypeptidase regulatory-like domain-containing protein [Bryobacteraceae bacterium]